MDVYSETQDESNTGVVLSGTLDSDTKASIAFTITSNITFQNVSLGTITFTNSGGNALNFTTNPQGVQGSAGGQTGMRLGITFTSTSEDFTLIGCGLSYCEESYFGN